MRCPERRAGHMIDATTLAAYESKTLRSEAMDGVAMLVLSHNDALSEAVSKHISEGAAGRSLVTLSAESLDSASASSIVLTAVSDEATRAGATAKVCCNDGAAASLAAESVLADGVASKHASRKPSVAMRSCPTGSSGNERSSVC